MGRGVLQASLALEWAQLTPREFACGNLLDMAVKCATCSEDFLGAVNRCWKCGSYVSLNLEAFQTPPIRRGPVVLRPRAKPALPETVNIQAGMTEPAAAAIPQSGAAAPIPGAVRRRGNPFANEANQAVFVPVASETLANELAAEKGVWIGLIVAILTWILAFVFPPAAVVTAIVAIGLAIWGLSSRKKAFAGALIVLCVLGFIVGGYQSAMWAYDLIAPEFTPSEVEEDF